MNAEALTIYLLLFTVAAAAMLVYYRKIRQGSHEYSRAKTALEDIVLSFNRDLQTQKQRIQEAEDRNQKAWTENMNLIQKIDSDVSAIKNQVQNLGTTERSLQGDYETLKRRVDGLVLRPAEVADVGVVEPLGRQTEIPQIAAEPTIIIRRDKALAPLTGTELQILRVLDGEGEKTAPQIRQVVRLTREHTARLMKKLYVSGYIERDTRRMPYVYRIKKEMKDILRPESRSL